MNTLHLHPWQALGKDVAEVTEVVSHNRGLLRGIGGLQEEEQALMEDALDTLSRRLGALDSVVENRCDTMRSRMQELTSFQVKQNLKIIDI